MTLYRVSDRSDTFVLDNGKAPATLERPGAVDGTLHGGPDMHTLTPRRKRRLP